MPSPKDTPRRFRRARAARERRERQDRRDTLFIYILIGASVAVMVGLVWLGSVQFA